MSGPRGDETSYQFDSSGAVKSVSGPSGVLTYESLSADSTSVRTHKAEGAPGRDLVTIRRDSEGRPVEFRYPDGTFVRFEFQRDRLVSAENDACKVTLKYDDAGFVIGEETLVAGDQVPSVVSYRRNAVGSITAITGPSGHRIDYQRDGEHRLRRIRNSEDSWDVSYDAAGSLDAIRYPNGVTLTRTNHPIGYPLGQSIQLGSQTRVIPDLQWTYDECDRLRSEQSGNRIRVYAYDAEGRLVAEDSEAGRTEWPLDADGNPGLIGGHACSYDLSNELVQRGDERYEYDALGNLLSGSSPKGRIECRYNGRGQMVESRTGGVTTRYVYDAFGRRIRKQSQGVTVTFTWAGQWLLAETEDRGGRTSRCDYILAPDLGVPLALRRDGRLLQIHHGRRSEPLAMTDSTGTAVWKGEWRPHGMCAVSAAAGTVLALRLPGQYYDEETGLHYNIARYYDPILARFLSRDPLGAEGGCWNEYIYGGGDPLNRCDPTGELLPLLLGAAAIGAVIGGGVEAYKQYKAGKGFDPWKIGKEAAIGGTVAVVGALVAVGGAAAVAAAAPGIITAAAAGGPVLAAAATAGTIMGGGALVGAASAATEACTHAGLHGEVPKLSDVLDAAETGAKIGAVTAGIGALWAGRARRAAQAAREMQTAGRSLPKPQPTAAKVPAGTPKKPSPPPPPKTPKRAPGKASGKKSQPDADKHPCTKGCPVETIGGQVVEWKTDFVLPGALELSLRRSYSSGLEYSGCLGPRWTLSWGESIDAGDGTATYVGGDGGWAEFDFDQADSEGWISHPEVAKTSLRQIPEGFEVRNASRHLLSFRTRNADRWLLSEIQDPNGHWIRFSHDPKGALREVNHSGGYRLAVEGSPTQLSRISLLVPGGRPIELVRYQYDLRSRLSAVIDGSGLPFRYQYDDANRMTRWEDRNGAWNEYQYDAQGRCIRTSGPGKLYHYDLRYDEKSRTNTATDSFGNIHTYIYNERQQPVTQVDARGGVTRTTWDIRNNRLRERDPEGRGFDQEFDADGNLTLVRDMLGRATRIRYNNLGLPESVTDAAGSVWTRAYDDRGNLVQAAGPDGAIWRYQRDAQGNVVKVEDPAGYGREFGYDTRGLPVWSTDAKGNRTSWTRDAMGRVTEEQDPLGRRTGFRYNALGKLAEVRRADGTAQRFEYDAEGNLVKRIGPDGKAYQYTYGAFDLLSSITKPSGGKLRLTYDTEARLTAVENEIGQLWRYQYNATGQVVREQDFHGRVLRFDYDGSGLCKRRTNGLGEETRLARDLAGQLVAETGAIQSRYEYDPLGRIQLAVRDEIEVRIEHDAYGRPIREWQDGLLVESAYESRGLRVKRSTTHGGDCEWQWDGNGAVTAVKLPGKESLEFQYDAGGREVERRARGGLVIRQEYDALDRLAKQWAGAALPGFPDPAVVSREYRYNVNGDPSEIRDARRGISRYTYDDDGRIARADRERGLSEEFRYDPAGNINGSREGRPQDTAASGQVTFTSRFFSRDGRLEKVGSSQYAWDADGRLSEKREGSRRWRYQWSADGRLDGFEGPDGRRWRYRYDAFGRRVRKEGPDGTTRYLWDGVVVSEEVGTGGAVSSWLFEPDSFRPLASREKGTVSFCVTDQIGTPRELVSGDGRVVWFGDMRTWGTEQPDGASSVNPIRFQGQWQDPESGLHYNLHRYYDPDTGQFLSSDPVGLDAGTRSYGYVHNPLAWVDPLGLAGCPPGRSGALNEAKRDLRIPRTQHPESVRRVPMSDTNGNWIMGKNGKPIMTREYTFVKPDGTRVVIQEHSAGHQFGAPRGVGDQGPHFNVRPPENTRTGEVAGTKGHYPFNQ